MNEEPDKNSYKYFLVAILLAIALWILSGAVYDRKENELNCYRDGMGMICE